MQNWYHVSHVFWQEGVGIKIRNLLQTTLFWDIMQICNFISDYARLIRTFWLDPGLNCTEYHAWHWKWINVVQSEWRWLALKASTMLKLFSGGSLLANFLLVHTRRRPHTVTIVLLSHRNGKLPISPKHWSMEQTMMQYMVHITLLCVEKVW